MFKKTTTANWMLLILMIMVIFLVVIQFTSKEAIVSEEGTAPIAKKLF
jgi:hypothetical protein